MGKTCKYEDGWSFTEAQGLKAESSLSFQQNQDIQGKILLLNGATR